MSCGNAVTAFSGPRHSGSLMTPSCLLAPIQVIVPDRAGTPRAGALSPRGNLTRMDTYSRVMRDPRAPAGSGPHLVTSDVQVQWAGPGRPAATLSNLNLKEGRRRWCHAGASVIVRGMRASLTRRPLAEREESLSPAACPPAGRRPGV